MTSAAEIAARHNLRRTGREWRGTCPLCGYRDTFRVTQRDGRTLLNCTCAAREGMAALLGADCRKSASMAPPESREREAEARRRRAAHDRALALWQGGEPVPGTPAATYLAVRGLPWLATSDALRLRGDTPHPGGGRLPAMLGLVVDQRGEPLGLHRTFLRRDGAGKAAVEPAKASLGPIWGGAIRLDPAAPELVIGEGIETSASAGLLIALPAWAAISAGNLARGLALPAAVRALVIAADADMAGEQAAQEAARRWQLEGRRVRIARPKHAGADFNDLLRASAAVHHG